MNTLKRILPLLCLLALLVGAFGCQNDEGPAEKAGKKIDQTMEEAGDKIEDMGDKIEDKLDK